MDKLKDLFLKKVPTETLLIIYEEKETYGTKITHKLEGNYSYVNRLISKFEELNLIKTKKDGRKKIIRLTDEGKRVVESLKSISSDINLEENKKNSELNKLQKLENKIDKIYEEELKNKDELSKKESSRIGKRLGPYKREVRKLKNKEIDDEHSQKIKKIEDKISELMSKKQKITEKNN